MGKPPLGLVLKQVCHYINDLSDDLSATAKLCADDTSLFFHNTNVDTSASRLNSDLSKIRNCAF